MTTGGSPSTLIFGGSINVTFGIQLNTEKDGNEYIRHAIDFLSAPRTLTFEQVNDLLLFYERKFLLTVTFIAFNAQETRRFCLHACHRRCRRYIFIWHMPINDVYFR